MRLSKWNGWLLGLALLVAGTANAANRAGDANNSGTWTSADRVLALEAILDIAPPGILSPMALVDGDGDFTLNDAMRIAQKVAGKRSDLTLPPLPILTFTPPPPVQISTEAPPADIAFTVASAYPDAPLVDGMVATFTIVGAAESTIAPQFNVPIVGGKATTTLTPLNSGAGASNFEVRVTVTMLRDVGGLIQQNNAVAVSVAPTVCGDGIVQSGETCDDGDSDSCTAGCNATCTGPSALICGDGILECGETCDDGDTDDCTVGCAADCSGPYFVTCGDGIAECSEVCDDGDTDDCTPGCNATCSGPYPLVCGDGLRECGEVCDDGDSDDCTGTCDGTCSGPVNTCGDGVVRCGEACDDGDANDCTPACDATCNGPSLLYCGNGTVECGETCDDGDTDNCTGPCDATCSGPSNVCGDGNVDCGEVCDDGDTDDCTSACNATCSGPHPLVCGDGVEECDEACDDGNTDDCFGDCLGDCSRPSNTCGDGIVECGEVCDDGDTDDCTPLCNATCTGPHPVVCGDGTAECEEECDDGNTLDCDGCNADCRLQTGCGDGTACGGEVCDDGVNRLRYLGSISMQGEIRHIAIAGDRLVITVGYNTIELAVLDPATDPPTLVGSLDTSSFDISVVSLMGKPDRTYILTGAPDIYVFDITSGTPSVAGYLPLLPPYWGFDATLGGDRIYMTNGFEEGIVVYDVSTDTPVQVGAGSAGMDAWSVGGQLYQLYLVYPRLYALGLGIGPLVYDISGNEPEYKAGYISDNPGTPFGPAWPYVWTQDEVITGIGQRAFLVNDELYVLEHINSTPLILGSVALTSRASDIVLQGRWAMVNRNSGIDLLDVTTGSPVLLETLSFAQSWGQAVVYRDRLYIADGDLHVFALEGRCSADCTTPVVCGDGAWETIEECDDGNTLDGDGCSADCVLEAPAALCGDGIVNAFGEWCDDGDTSDCTTACAAECGGPALGPVCGDGVVECNEVCDGGPVTMPTPVETIASSPMLDMEIQQDLLYLPLFTGIDVYSTDQSPTVYLGTMPTSDIPYDLEVSGNRAVLGMEQSIQLLNTSSPVPTVLDSYTPPCCVMSVAMEWPRIYIGTDWNGIVVLDATGDTLNYVGEASGFAYGGFRSLAVSGTTLFAGFVGNVIQLDVSGATPLFVAELQDGGGGGFSLEVDGKYLVAGGYDGIVYLYDVNRPTAIELDRAATGDGGYLAYMNRYNDLVCVIGSGVEVEHLFRIVGDSLIPYAKYGGTVEQCAVDQRSWYVLDSGNVNVINLSTEGQCTSTCDAIQTCGNGTPEGSEHCDDGNTLDGDGCAGDCLGP